MIDRRCFLRGLGFSGLLTSFLSIKPLFSGTPQEENSVLLEAGKNGTSEIPPIVPHIARYAVLVGWDIEKNNPGVFPEYSDNDTAAMADYLEKQGWDRCNIVRMTNGAPSVVLYPKRSNILAVLKLIAEQAREQDEIFVLFSGTGGLGEGHLWFLPMGADSIKSEKWISQDEITAILKTSAAKKIYLMNLTNRYTIHKTPEEREASLAETQQKVEQKQKKSSDPLQDGIVIETAEQSEAEKPKTSRQTLTLISSCSEDEESFESTERELDLFLSCFLDAADEKGNSSHEGEIDFEAIFNRSQEILKKRIKKEEKVQNPEWRRL